MSQISQSHKNRREKSADKWYTMSADDVLIKLDSSKNGLTQDEVEERLKQYGENKLPESRRQSRLKILITQFKSSLVYILLAASLISALLKDFVDAGVILLAVVINVIIGFYQENKAETALSSLRKIVVNHCQVMRDGHKKQIETKNLVPGDIVFLSPGDKIPADLRILQATDLKTNEAPLTGESGEIDKNNQTLSGDFIIADQTNMAFMGTAVTQGNAIGVVTSTADSTALGHIASLVAGTGELVTPLQRRLNIFSRKISLLVLAICLLIFGIGLASGRSFIDIFITAIAVAVSAVPEGLLVAVTMVLAVGMQRILKKKALVKHLLAAEILGSTSVICADKTGTLTEGEMRVVEISTPEHHLEFSSQEFNPAKHQPDDYMLILHAASACNNAYTERHKEKQDIVRGMPTEKALLLAARSVGISKKEIDKEEPRLDEIPFDSAWKFMMTLHKGKGRNTVYLKGAPEIVMQFSKYVYSTHTKDKHAEITTEHRKKLQQQYEEMSRRGLRVLALAYKQVGETSKKLDKVSQDNFIFLGLLGIKDPVRSNIKKIIDTVKQAGLKTVMITGDHALTAASIAKEIGLSAGKKNIISGHELAQLDDKQLKEKVKDITVYARVTPEDKLRIVKAWQDRGHVVAMTGDGINDAPALKKANIGISVGSGTDVAKETADMILLDDNFKTIVAAVKEGRVIYDNIKKVILYFLSDSFTEVIIIVASLLAGWPLPILASQIIWINLIDDTFPALALTQEPPEGDIMHEHPEKRSRNILDKERKILIATISIFTAIGTLFIFHFFNRFGDLDLARTAAFSALAFDSLLYVFSVRSLRKPIWHTNPFNNRFLIFGVVIGILLQLLVVYNPFLQKVFHTVSLGWQEWFVIIMECILVIGLIEFIKSLYYNKGK